MTVTDQKVMTEKGSRPSDTQLGDVDDLQDLNVLGYKPELRRNRSMFTLLFQSLAIAAVSVLLIILHLIRGLNFPADTIWIWQPANICRLRRRYVVIKAY